MILNKKILSLLIILIALVSISAVSAENVAIDDVATAEILSMPTDDTVVVEASSEADDVLGTSYDVPNNANVSEIETIIANTSAGDTLNFAENGTYDFGNNSDPIEISHTLILQGNNATIKGYQGFIFQADEESVAGSQVYNLNFEIYQPVLWQGRALDFEGGSDYIIEHCSFRNGNSGIYVRRPAGNVTIVNNEFFADEGATNASTVKKDWGKQETGSKAINLMGGTGITITNNTFEGDFLDAISIASGAANVDVINNYIAHTWYGIFYGGGVTNVTTAENKFIGSKAFALGIIKAAGNSEIYDNVFSTPENETAIYVQEGNTAHGAPSNIETIHIMHNKFYGDKNTTAVAAESQGGMITPKGDFTVALNQYHDGVIVFSFTDNNTYTFTSDNFISEEKRIYIESNILMKKLAGLINIDESSVNATLVKDASGYLLVDVDGIGYYVPVESGEASFDMPILTPGNYTIVATYTGDEFYAPITETENITIKESIISEDLLKVEKSPARFEATFTDVKGTPLANTNVTVEINRVTSLRTTDANGTISMAINLPSGEYTAILTNPVTGEVKENLITVTPRIISYDLVKYYRNASKFVAYVMGDDGAPAKAGENVTFNINGVFYTRQVKAVGEVELAINLPAGNYTITTEYKDCKAANNIEVLPIITASDLTKKFGSSTPFEATLVDGQGKPYANQEIEFNINGVFYKRTTDSNGVAQLNINLIAGEYIITSSFNGFNTSNKVTITN